MASSISVILPCFNAAATLGILLAALARQRWREGCEIVIVDNGSTDGSMDLVEGYRVDLPPVRMLQAFDPAVGRLGVANSYAHAFRAAAGDAVLLCEADDEVADDWFEHMATALDQHEFVAAALEYRKLNPPEFHPTGSGQQSVESGLSNFSGPLYLPYASGCSMGLRKSVIDRIGTPTLELGPSWDVDYCWQAHLAGIHLQFVPDAVIHYRLRHDFKSRFRQAWAWGCSHVDLHNKYRPRSGVRHAVAGAKRMLLSIARLRDVALGRRTIRYWAWDLGWAMGVLAGARRSIRGRW